MPDAAALRGCLDGEGRLAVRVTPGAKVEAMEVASGSVTVKVRAKPEGGKANDAVIAMVAKALGVAPSRIALLRGATSREKLLRVLT